MKDIGFPAEDVQMREFWAADVAIYPAEDKQVLVHARSTGATCHLHATYGELLMQCSEFKSLDEHLAAFCQRKQIDGKQISGEIVQSLRHKLQQFAQDGYLIPHSRFRDLFRGTDKQTFSSQITTLGFPTCERVEILEQVVASYLEHCQRFGRTADFVVMDDSPSLTTREAYRQMLRGLQARSGITMAYAGVEEKMAYVRKLSEVGKIPEEVVSWACLGDRTYGASTHGANRNVLLLHTIGEYIFSSDDDTICRVAASPGYQEGLTVRSQKNLLQYWYYPDRKSILESVQPVERDILALHEQWLGQDPRVSGAPYSRAGQLSIKQADPGFLHHLATQPGKIILTMNGIVGDASHRSNDLLFFHPEESFNRQTSSEQAYLSARTSREMAQVTNQLTLAAKSRPVINIGGLDNRELLPPFAPVGRGEDTAFTFVLETCFSNAYYIYLPWVLLHTPPEARSYTESSFDVPFYEWLLVCIGLFHLEQPGGTPADHLSQLGQFLEHIGELPTSDFEEFARQVIWESDKKYLYSLEGRISKGEGLPASWKRDAEMYCAKLRQNMLLPVKQRLQGGPEIAQRLLVQFAQILYWWPTMVETARCLRAEGCRVAQPL